jgi:hypothetical protein
VYAVSEYTKQWHCHVYANLGIFMAHFKGEEYVEDRVVIRACAYLTRSDGIYGYIELPISDYDDSANYDDALSQAYLEAYGTYDAEGNYTAPDFTITSVLATEPSQ